MQTIDSDLDAHKTIDNSHKEKVQQGRDIGSPTSKLALELVADHEVSCAFTGCGFVSHRSLLPACFDNDKDAVIPCTDTLKETPPSIFPFLSIVVARHYPRRN